MPIVNQLSYNMKIENSPRDNVKLVGFVKNCEEAKESIEDRLGNGCSPMFWKRFDTKNEKKRDNGKAIANSYVNSAFHMNETNCHCMNQKFPSAGDSVPHGLDYCNGKNNNGLHTVPGSDSCNTGSSNGSSWAEDKMRRCCSKKVLYKRIPVFNLFQTYKKDMFMADLVAGITVGLTMIPQAIAYANVAGLPSKYGLYSAFLGCLVYVVFGSCKESSVGPTAIMAILIRENIHGLGPPFAILLCFLTGLVQLLMGFLQLGFLVDFISGPVSAGFTSAAAIVIAMTQVKDLLGLNFGANKFIEVWNQLSKHFREISVEDASLGFSCMFVLLLLRKVKDIRVGPEDTQQKTPLQRYLSMILWFLSTARNILVVVICGCITYVCENWYGEVPFKLSDPVEPGLPKLEPPPFSTTVQNTTFSFIEMTSTLGSGIVVVPLLALLENISGAKVFSNGRSIDATQELLALGMCNVAASFVGSMPVSGGLSRGAINHASGVKSTISCIYTGIVVILSLKFLTPCFTYIPKASLAAVIIAAVVFMVEFHVVKPMWKTKKIDLIPAAATFVSSLLIRLEVGILVGVSINVLFLLYSSARPTVHVDKFKSEWGYEYIVITPDRSLAFPSVEYVRNVVSKAGVKQGYSSIPIIIDSRHVHGADFTAAKGIKSLIEDFVKRNQLLLFYNLKPSVVEIFRGVQPCEFHHVQTEEQLHNFLKAYYFYGSKNTPMVKS